MFVLDEIHVRGVQIIEDRIWVENVQEIIPKDHQRALVEGPKNQCAGCPRQTVAMEQSTASHGCDIPSKGPVVRYLAFC